MSETKDVIMKTEEEEEDTMDVIEDNEKSVNKKSNKKSNNIPIASSESSDGNDKIAVTLNETNTTPATVSTTLTISSTSAQPSTATLPSTTITSNNNTDTSSSSSSSSSSSTLISASTSTPSVSISASTSTPSVSISASIPSALISESTTSSTSSSTTTAAILPKKRTKQEVIVEIEELISEKKNIENKLATLEKQIYALEGRYLEDTHHVGNVIRGFDSYISGSGALKKLRWKENDRLFSTSSSTYLNSISDRNEIVEQDNGIKKKRDKGKLSSSSSSHSKKN
ncbi:hypothetical protein ACTA71_002473 [Dictyostelium dimigraforme]